MMRDQGTTAFYCEGCNQPINASGDCGCGRGSYYFEEEEDY